MNCYFWGRGNIIDHNFSLLGQNCTNYEPKCVKIRQLQAGILGNRMSSHDFERDAKNRRIFFNSAY